MRLRVDYYDQNEPFGQLLPRTGVVQATPRCADSRHVWHLLRLDEPLWYEGTEYSHFLLASRWAEHHIGESEAASVFILLVPSGATVADGFSHKTFLHVAWGMVCVESAGG